MLRFACKNRVALQETKSKQRIKIVVADGSDTKIIIDTLLKDGTIRDSIRLKDGKVIYIGHPGDKALAKSHGSNEHVFVKVMSDGDDPKKEVKEITIVSSDSANLAEAGEHSKLYVYSDVNSSDKETEKTFDVHVSSGDKESSVDKTRYVIAKDGMVVTVEGTDETKTKELVMEIEKKLGIKREGSDTEKPTKTETGKSTSKE